MERDGDLAAVEHHVLVTAAALARAERLAQESAELAANAGVELVLARRRHRQATARLEQLTGQITEPAR